MPVEVTIGGEGTLFVGEDKTLRLELASATDALAAVDMAGWTMVFDVRLKDTSPDPPILSAVPVVSGVFNAVRATNLQRALVTLTDDDMNLFKAKNYRWSWKRTTSGNETVLGRGNFSPEKATAP